MLHTLYNKLYKILHIGFFSYITKISWNTKYFTTSKILKNGTKSWLCHAHALVASASHLPFPHLIMASAPPPKVSATTEPAVEKAPPTIKKDRGIVKSVLSGDTLVVLEDKPSTQGPPTDKIITLSSLLAPKLARGDNKEEVLLL